MRQHVKLREDRDEQINFSINADKNADVQMVVNTNSLTIFLDLTLKEARDFRKALDKSIVEFEQHQRRLDQMFRSSQRQRKLAARDT